MMTNSDTLIIRFYGLHRVKARHLRKYHFVVMANIFAQALDIHDRYDLKVRRWV